MRVNADMTIWNKYAENGKEAFRRTQIKNVSWVDGRGVTVNNTGFSTHDEIRIRIPLIATFEGDREYIDSVEARKGLPQGRWTIRNGDVVQRGLSGEEKPPAYGVFEVVSYSDNRDVRSSPNLRHWRIIAK